MLKPFYSKKGHIGKNPEKVKKAIRDLVPTIIETGIPFDVVGANIFIKQEFFSYRHSSMPTTSRDVWYHDINEEFATQTEATNRGKELIRNIGTEIERLINLGYNVYFLVNIPSEFTMFNGMTPYITNVPIIVAHSTDPATIIGERYANGDTEVRVYLSNATKHLTTTYIPTLSLDINGFARMVAANPTGEATDTLTKIRIGDKIYSV